MKKVGLLLLCLILSCTIVVAQGNDKYKAKKLTKQERSELNNRLAAEMEDRIKNSKLANPESSNSITKEVEATTAVGIADMWGFLITNRYGYQYGQPFTVVYHPRYAGSYVRNLSGRINWPDGTYEDFEPLDWEQPSVFGGLQQGKNYRIYEGILQSNQAMGRGSITLYLLDANFIQIQAQIATFIIGTPIAGNPVEYLMGDILTSKVSSGNYSSNIYGMNFLMNLPYAGMVQNTYDANYNITGTAVSTSNLILSLNPIFPVIGTPYDLSIARQIGPNLPYFVGSTKPEFFTARQ